MLSTVQGPLAPVDYHYATDAPSVAGGYILLRCSRGHGRSHFLVKSGDSPVAMCGEPLLARRPGARFHARHRMVVIVALPWVPEMNETGFNHLRNRHGTIDLLAVCSLVSSTRGLEE